jgi:hypothetical protein
MPERSWRWSYRVHFPSDSMTSLDWGMELWNWDVALYESADGIVEALDRRLARTGRPYDDDSILAEATMTLLTDVIDAAGGVESAYNRICEALARTQDSYDKSSANFPRPPAGETFGFSDLALEDAWYALEDLLTWTPPARRPAPA